MHLFIVGYMGSGKTTAGRKIAARVGWPLVDLDKLFEDTYKTSIPAVFDRFGEDAFREMERKLLLQVANSKQSQIVSTGGGTPYYFDNFQIMKSHGRVVYFKLPAPVLAARLQHSPFRYRRPLLRGLDSKALLQRIREHLTAREPVYEQADLIVETENIEPNELVSIILSRFPDLFTLKGAPGQG